VGTPHISSNHFTSQQLYFSLYHVSVPRTDPGSSHFASQHLSFIKPSTAMNQVTPTTLPTNQWQSRRNSGSTV